MIVISSREFRQNQRLYFDKVDKGEQVIVQRGKDKAYVLTPVNENDMYFSEAMVKRIKESIKQAEQGEVKTISSSEEIDELLGL
jgi:PHD/YefM family antitoxin component YafN of YafNO toxin-antitoxin module